MLEFHFHPGPNPMKIALFLAETGLDFELVPVDTLKGEQHSAAFRAINPNGKTPAIVDDGQRVFDSNAILLYLAEKTGQLAGQPEERAELLSWLMFVATGWAPIPASVCTFAMRRLRGSIMRSTGTCRKRGGIMPYWKSTWRVASSSWVRPSPSRIWPPGAGSTRPRWCLARRG